MQRERKDALRTAMLQYRRGLPEQFLADASARIRERLQPLLTGRTVFAYYPVSGEPDLLDLHTVTATFALPRITGGQMVFCPVEDPLRDTPDRYRSIPQPAAGAPAAAPDCNTIVLVPGTAFDRRGFRLGYGGGFYDRWLEHFSGLSIGICYGELILDELPAEAHDLPVDRLCSESGIIDCAALRNSR